MTTQNIWEKFDKSIDTKALKEDAAKAADQGDFPEVPHGTYEVKFEKLEQVVSKTGKPMISAWLKILDGEYKGQRLFYNQVMHVGFGLSQAVKFLSSLDSGVDVKFENFGQFNDLVLDIHEAIDGVSEYAIEYGEEKGYNTFKIVDVFDAQ
ncbi:hypothetical protein D3C74_175200 [compost metagenome]